MSESPLERSLHAQQASLTNWSRVEDRAAAMQPLRDGFTRKLEREIDPEGRLSSRELERRVEMARKAHMAKMTRLAVKARRERAAAKKS
jgi:hypothetical protein